MFLYPLIFTFCSSLFSGSIIARYLGVRGSIVFCITCLVGAFVSSCFIWYEIAIAGCEVSINLMGSWFEVGSFHAQWNFHYDLLTAHMLFTVTSVSLAVHLYSAVYMRADPHLQLFYSYLSLFTFFMLVLVCSDNLMLMLVGWEGIGVCSYLLIGYYGHRLSAVKSAQKAILVNRVSDGMLLWGVLWIWWHTGSLEYDLVLLNASIYATSFLSLAILIGCMGKSAQILFHVWLADAMEGPTPVSALIHAATLVTAGVFLMVRLNVFWDDIVLFVGSLTAFMAGIFGFFQNDLKRVIAFSTCSQLGYMMVSVALSEIGADASMCHLMTHASFKAALFLGAGVIIMSTNGNQHMARYGALSSLHTSMISFYALLIGCICLVGFPETSGFYSKETILNLAFITYSPLADFAHTLLILAALITSCYTAKLFIQCFFLDFSGSDLNVAPLSKPTNPLIAIALSILLLDVVFKIWVGTNLLSGILFFVPWGVKNLPAGLVIAGFLSASVAATSKQFGLIRFFATRWGFDQLYARTVVQLVLDWGRITWTAGDKGLFYVGDIKTH
uniref:NADH-ubiquinone oxidoreductase chain 5 n=1 Tax=Volvocales sp. NrCl902 TaxID=2682054 RepID=A0A7G1GGB5_9CHLO|nr:NADH dehydrogenase subunit 5 [Volvocales sp. NrCl902]